MWESCGLRFRFSKSLGLLPPMAEELGYGKAVHHMLRLVAEEAMTKKEVPSWDRCEAIALEGFFAPYANKPTFERMRKAALGMLRTYYDDHRDDLERIWATERPFELHTDEGIVSGRADVILDRQGGDGQRMAIVDYKISKGDELLPQYEQQLRVYTAVGRGEGLKVDAAYLHALRESRRDTVDVGETVTGQAVEQIKGAMASIRKGDHPAKPNENVCKSCDYNRVCLQCHPKVKTAFEF